MRESVTATVPGVVLSNSAISGFSFPSKKRRANISAMRGFRRASALAEPVADFARRQRAIGPAVRRFGQHRLEIVERNVADVLARADQIDRRIHGSAVEKAGDTGYRFGRRDRA